ncbi:uncharacterized protein H6S33_003360 [Morchella sextelata]|uniref:uncharacterized protein n=1 Tax=Morchella sextelata TaxID=1174677 RepID=UPI001D03BD4D|nr:uncharacterized protein H6S33_003360 [Morchella sextelata]KAH0606526.1 hypothetical protein H6S33_003360 [Morchella sextelata]
MVADPKSLPTTGHMEICNTYELAKFTKSNLAPLTGPRSKQPLEQIHSYLCDKFSIPSLRGFSYYITFIDDYSKYAHLYFLKKKSDAAAATQRHIAYMENQIDKTVKWFRSDNGGEYISNDLQQFFATKDIKHEFTIRYSHESNGTAKHFNKMIATMTRSALLDHDLPRNLWAEAMNTMVHFKNHLPHKAFPNMTPYEAVTGKKLFIGHL